MRLNSDNKNVKNVPFPALCLFHQVGLCSNGHISRRLVTPSQLGGHEVIPSLLLPSTSGSYHFISPVGEGGGWESSPSSGLSDSQHEGEKDRTRMLLDDVRRNLAE